MPPTPFRRASLAREPASNDAQCSERRLASKRTSLPGELLANAQGCTTQRRPCGPSTAHAQAILSPGAVMVVTYNFFLQLHEKCTLR